MIDGGLIPAATAVYMVHKILGPVSEEIGEDLRRAYKTGREKIVVSAYRKLENPEDGKRVNLRVANDVLWNGGPTDDEVCAEYFGGILASCRSEDGKDDSAIQFSSVIKSLSSSQLCLHYVIYNVFNKMLVAKQVTMNVASSPELDGRAIWLSALELFEKYKIQSDTDFNALYQQGLVSKYEFDTRLGGDPLAVSYGKAVPTSFGVLLYAAAHNRVSEWINFPKIDFGDFESIPTPRYFGATLNELKKTHR